MATYIWAGDNGDWQSALNWDLVYYVAPNGDQYYEQATTPPGAGDYVEFLYGYGSPTDAATITSAAAAGFIGIDADYSLTFNGAAVTAETIDAYGDLYINNGAAVSATNVSSPSVYTQGSGGIDVSGMGTTLTTVFLYVGISGSGGGSLNVNSGASVNVIGSVDTSTYFSVGQGGNGSAIDTGAGSSIAETGGVAIVGFDSTGSLTISDGASASFSNSDDEQLALDIGSSENSVSSNGTVTVTGDGSSLTTADGVVQIGNGSRDTGTLKVLAGASASFTQTSPSSPTLVIGDDDSTGVVDVFGEDSTLTTTSGGVQISNHGGTGTLDIDDGGAVIVDNTVAAPPAFQIGLGADSTGTVIVDDASSLSVDAAVWLGAVGGVGSLAVTNESLFGTALDLSVGDDASTHGGASEFTLNTGSTADTGDADFGVAAGAKGDGIVNGGDPLYGTNWTVTGVLTVGDAGTGDLTVEDDAALTITNSDADQPSLSVGAQATGVGDLTVEDDTTLDLGAGGAIVGDAGHGTLAISGQSTLEVSSPRPTEEYALTLGNQSGSVGEAGVSDGSTLTIGDGGLAVGDDGAATLSVDDSTLTVTSASFGFIVAANQGSNAVAGVSGAGASIQIIDNVADIGDGGLGSLSVDDDGSFDVTGANGLLDVGVEASGTGSLTLDGSGASLNYGGQLTIGDAGDGSFELDDGATFLLNDDIIVAAQTGSSGAIGVDGQDSSLTANNITVGDDGFGTMTADDGGAITVDVNLVIGNQLSESVQSSYVNVDDATSSLTVHDDLTVGDDGAGSLSIDGDSTVYGTTTVASGGGIRGVVTVTGATFTLDDELIVGGQGTGSFTVEAKGVLDAAMQSVALGDGEGGQGTLTVEGDNTAASMDSLTIGLFGQGALDVLDGADVTTNGYAALSELPGDQGDTASVDGLSTWTVDGTLSIASAGQAAVSVTNGGNLIANSEIFIGDDIASSGKLTIDGDDASADISSSLTYAGPLIVGDDGVGTLIVSNGGLVSFADGAMGEIDIGSDPDGQGTVTVEDEGSLLEADDLTVGGAQGQESGSGILNISEDGKVSVSTLTVTGSGIVDLNDGTLETDPITIDAGGKVSGAGEIVGDIHNSGEITASDGELDVDDQVGGALVIDADSALDLKASVLADATVQFAAGGDGELDLGDPLSFEAHEIDGFVAGDEIDLVGFSYDGPETVVLGPTDTLSLEDVADQTANLTFDEADIGETFSMTGDGEQGTLVEFGVLCYGRGTRILSDRGEVAIEALSIGDRVMTLQGEARPIKWIGRRKIDLARHPRPELSRPVRIATGALGEGLPVRDLLLSPEHALWLHDVLVPARDLLNGATIRQEACARVEYFHVELDSHDVLIAEGVPAESYLDCDNRRGFDNAPDGVVTLHPDWRRQAASRPFASAALTARLRTAFADRAVAAGRTAEIEEFDAEQRARGRVTRTNFVRNPRAEGSVSGILGAGGQAPLHWRLAAPEGVAVEIAGVGVEDGLPFVDLRFVGRAARSGHACIYPEARAAAARANQDWTVSCYLRHVGGGLAGVERVNLYMDECAADGAYLTGQDYPQPPPTADELALQRMSATRRMSRRDVAAMTGYIQIELAADTPIDVTLRVAGLQIEAGAYASDLMLPPPGQPQAVTRLGEEAPARQEAA